jgi:hypothetical protein
LSGEPKTRYFASLRLAVQKRDDELLARDLLGNQAASQAMTHASRNGAATQVSCFVPESPNGSAAAMLRISLTAFTPVGMGRAQMATAARKADTRRKIQLGGLIIKAGFASEESAVLLGMLMAGAMVLNAPNAMESRRRWNEPDGLTSPCAPRDVTRPKKVT